MPRIHTNHLAEHAGERVTLTGWLHALRRMGSITFVILRDGWGTAQIVCEDPAIAQQLEDANAGVESILCIRGIVRPAPQVAAGFEMGDPEITILEAIAEPPPVTLSKATLRANLTTLLDSAVVTNRHPMRRAVLRLDAGVMAGFRRTLDGRDFTEIQTPKIVASATEGGANVFQLDYFGRAAYLAQSPQFYKQIMVGAFERVYEVGPIFRAEPHDTTRHLNEYVSLDAEMGFIADHFTVMALLRDVIAGICDHLTGSYAPELTLTQANLPSVPPVIPHIHFSEAQEWIWRQHGVDVRGEPDLSPQDERWLGEWARAEHGSDFLFVTGYPMRKRPFYTHPDPARPAFSNSFDLLFRGTELVTGGQRLHRYPDYLAALEQAGLPIAPFAEYLQAFRHGMPPHGGFAIGMERFVMQLVGLPSVKLAATFPRDLHRVTP